MKPFVITILLATTLWASDNEALIKEIEQSLMAPCCWSGTVYDHGHSELEAEITAFVNAGKTKDEIISYYVEKYGERILAAPVAQGFNLFAWIAPIAIGLAGLTIIAVYLRTAKGVPEPPPPKDTKIEFDDEIEKELKELD
ncbi:MAG: cytochrome c-type biogenesis protein CcmH [Fidelibacterota bacterium]